MTEGRRGQPMLPEPALQKVLARRPQTGWPRRPSVKAEETGEE